MSNKQSAHKSPALPRGHALTRRVNAANNGALQGHLTPTAPSSTPEPARDRRTEQHSPKGIPIAAALEFPHMPPTERSRVGSAGWHGQVGCARSAAVLSVGGAGDAVQSSVTERPFCVRKPITAGALTCPPSGDRAPRDRLLSPTRRGRTTQGVMRQTGRTFSACGPF